MNVILLSEIFEYKQGKLFAKTKGFRSRHQIGDRVGSKNKNGYWTVRYKNKIYLEHRLIYTMFYGDVPKFIDHINGDRLDNRIENLRPCTPVENQRNKKLSKVNKSGYKGVSWREGRKAWRVAIRTNGKRIEIGCFEDLELAGLVADMAREKYHGEFCRHY
jgi:hypothetical protein